MSLEYAIHKGYSDMDNVLNNRLEGKELEKAMIEYSSRLKGLIFKITKDEFILEDILQNTYLKAWTKRLTFRGDCSYSTWLYKIAINEALMYVKKNKKVREVDWANFEHITEIDPYSYMRCLDIENAFDYTLSEDMKKIVIGKMEGYSEKEIAKEFALPIGTVKTRYFRARKQLSNYMKETTC